MGAKAPGPTGPSKDDQAKQAEAERAARDREKAANEEIQSQSAAAYGRRTGRRMLLAPGREASTGISKTLG